MGEGVSTTAMRFAMVLALVGSLAGAAPLPTPTLLVAGKKIYDQACAACHGATGEGNGPVAFALKPPPRNFRADPFKAGDSVDQIFATITNGLPDTRMTGYSLIPEQDRWGLAYYVVTFRPPRK